MSFGDPSHHSYILFKRAFQKKFPAFGNIFHWKFVLLENKSDLCIVIDRKPNE